MFEGFSYSLSKVNSRKFGSRVGPPGIYEPLRCGTKILSIVKPGALCSFPLPERSGFSLACAAGRARRAPSCCSTRRTRPSAARVA